MEYHGIISIREKYTREHMGRAAGAAERVTTKIEPRHQQATGDQLPS